MSDPTHHSEKKNDGQAASMGLIPYEIVSECSKSSRAKNETKAQYIERVTHLHLRGGKDGRRLKQMWDFSPCKNLQVLYLYDNHLEDFGQLGKNKNLTHLHLENNNFSDISSIPKLDTLQKLYLDGNKIFEVDGLQSCRNLQELHLSAQRSDVGNEIGPRLSIQKLPEILPNLLVLDVSGNRLRSVACLSQLNHLEKLDISRNEIHDLQEIIGIVQRLARLQDLNTEANPCCKTVSYRETIIAESGSSLVAFDEKEVDPRQRLFTKRLKSRKTKQKTPVEEDAQEIVNIGKVLGGPKRGMKGSKVLHRQGSRSLSANTLDTSFQQLAVGSTHSRR